ncbi:MAG: nucleotidyl transferase AbiEii/AbiGii toxin family protein [Armatimonadetes bacterium]|nr:nucleotidyl transferase AbiEii/AbiGii toxin family protein [Armatimonadota bacterium]
MAVTRADYSGDQVEAAKSVMLELTRLLGEYRDDIVVIGGWVPELLFTGHVGSIDVDLALNHLKLQKAGYATIEKLLLSRGYRKSNEQPYVFYRTVVVNDEPIDVEVDLLAGEYAGTGKSRRHQNIQDIKARKARGCELAFDMTSEVTVSGCLPDGGKDTVTVRVASIVPFIVMKGMALYDRLKEKDAYDIYFCLKNYPGGREALVEEFRPHASHGLVKEALGKIAEKFASLEHVGPIQVADFMLLDNAEERERVQRDAFELADYLVRKLVVK